MENGNGNGKCFVSCLLFLLFYVSLRSLCSGTCRKIRNLTVFLALQTQSSTHSKAVLDGSLIAVDIHVT